MISCINRIRWSNILLYQKEYVTNLRAYGFNRTVVANVITLLTSVGPVYVFQIKFQPFTIFLSSLWNLFPNM